MYRAVTFFLLLVLSPLLRARGDEGTYCDDPAVWTDRRDKATKHPGNLGFHTLHALWIGR